MCHYCDNQTQLISLLLKYTSLSQSVICYIIIPYISGICYICKNNFMTIYQRETKVCDTLKCMIISEDLYVCCKCFPDFIFNIRYC